MFSHPHCRVELFGAFNTFTVMAPVLTSLLAHSVFNSAWPDLTMSEWAPCDVKIAFPLSWLWLLGMAADDDDDEDDDVRPERFCDDFCDGVFFKIPLVS